MSSSAVIVWVDKKGDDWSNNIGIYLHDGGSYNYVSAILRYCKLKEYRAPNECCYGYARFCQVIANFFMNGLGVGIDKVENLNLNCDNGVYVCHGWEVIDHFYTGMESDEGWYNILLDIDRCQPIGERLGKDYIDRKFLME